MIRGISFNIPNGISKIFSVLTKNICIQDYYWINIDNQDQVFSKSFEFFFDEFSYNGELFENKINSDDYYVISVKLQAYRQNVNAVELNSFDQFMKSDCEIMICIIDNIFVDIYAKDLDIIEKIKVNAKSNSYTNIEYITDKNDKLKD